MCEYQIGKPNKGYRGIQSIKGYIGIHSIPTLNLRISVVGKAKTVTAASASADEHFTGKRFPCDH